MVLPRIIMEVSFKVSPKLTFAGWAGLTHATAEDGDVAGVTTGDSARIFNWAATLAFTDLVRGQRPWCEILSTT